MRLQYPPVQFFTGTQRDDSLIAEREFSGADPVLANQGDVVGVARQAIEVCTEVAGEGFQFVEGIVLIKCLCIQFDRGMRGIAAGAAACGLLGVARVGG